jgi:streptogramin lyase
MRITPAPRRKCLRAPLRYHRSMSIRCRDLRLFVPCLLLILAGLAAAPALRAQSPTTVAAGTSLITENSRPVTGTRIEPQPDGTVWFLLPSNDRIVQLQADGVTMKQWQIRDDKDLGANPVDFRIDGNIIWFIENGESLIDAGRSIFARLDTTTGQLREWDVPGSRPASFSQTSDGKVWLPQTNGRLQSVDMTTLDVVDYRSPKTFAYADMVVGPDGMFWMVDFGDNRIVRYDPGSASETSWTFFDPNVGRLNPSQMKFDDQGLLWISMFSGGQMVRFNPATGELVSYTGFLDPIHFDIFAGRLYVAEAAGDNGRVVVLDPLLAAGSTVVLQPETLTVGAAPNKLPALIHDSTITPTVFTSTASGIAASDLVTTTTFPGLLRTQFPFVNAYGIRVAGGVVWVGSASVLARLVIQAIGSPSDLTVPVAVEFGVSPGERIVTDVTLFNRGDAPISGDILYLYSPATFAASKSYTVGPGQTILLSDALGGSSSNAAVLLGPVRVRVATGAAGDLAATVRTSHLLDDGSSYGFSIPARSSGDSIGPGSTRILFTGNRISEASIFGLFSQGGAQATAALLAPDGSVRGTRSFSLAANIAQEFNPAASAFGVPAEPGDVLVVSVSSGSLQPYVNVLDLGTFDTAISLPVATTRDAVFPNLGTLVGVGDTSFVSDLLLSNSDRANPANVTVSYFPTGTSDSPLASTLTLPPGASQVVADVLGTLFSVTAGQGALIVSSDVPVAVSSRTAARRTQGDYATFSAALDGADTIVGGSTGTAFGVPQTAVRRTHLLLFNNGFAGAVTVVGYDGQGNEVGRFSVDMAESQPVRVNSVMEQLGAPDQAVGRITVTSAPGMQLYAETAEVDLDTGDIEFARVK